MTEQHTGSEATGGKPYSLQLFAGWSSMDFNQHMRNAAYLGASEDTRMRFLAERGFSMEEFRKRQLGPVVVEDKLTYSKEIALLEGFRVELENDPAGPAQATRAALRWPRRTSQERLRCSSDSSRR